MLSDYIYKPRWTHDCNVCETLGRYYYYDLYYCCGSVIARYDSEGSAYRSMPITILLYAGLLPEDALVEAAKRKIEKWKARDAIRCSTLDKG